MMIALENFWRRLTGKEFRAFVHAPERMGVVLETAGLVRGRAVKHSFGHSTSIAVADV